MIRRLFTSNKNGNTITYTSKLPENEIESYINNLENDLQAFNTLMRGLRDEIKCAKEYKKLMDKELGTLK